MLKRLSACDSSPLTERFPFSVDWSYVLVFRLTVWEVVILRAAEPLSELLTVPHQQLLLGLHRPDGVEVDVPSVLAGHQVLLGQAARRVHVTHPVALVDIVPIDEVLKLSTAVNLQRKERERLKTGWKR